MRPTDIWLTDIWPTDIWPTDIWPTDIWPIDIQPYDIWVTAVIRLTVIWLIILLSFYGYVVQMSVGRMLLDQKPLKMHINDIDDIDIYTTRLLIQGTLTMEAQHN
jgi:hypothetical protein